MGMYTELILGCKLKKDTPEDVIQILKFLVGDGEKPKALPCHEFFTSARWDIALTMSSYYFAICESLQKFWKDKISETWIISTRSNIKNYDNEIEKFLDWLKPYIHQGSGQRNFFAISCYEASEEPTIYYLD